ncbi:MAG: cellulase family glycosylhydrolase [Lawsonibacter sp.]|nr:cellulase family glycosylhydrolase [Lawsonibacter sp.]
MRRSLNAAVLLTLLVLLSALPVRGEFSDVPAGSWYREAVTQMAEEGLLSGYPDGSFRPDASITAAEFVTITARCAGAAPVQGQTRHWAAGSMEAALQRGWYDWDELPPTGERFDQPISRQLAVKILMRALLPQARGDYSTESRKIGDFSTLSGRYYEPVLAAYAAGIVSGDGAGNFRPLSSLSRAEACVLFRNALRSQSAAPPQPSEPLPVPQPERTVQGGVSQNGWLQVIGTQLCNEAGNPVVLRGMSSHGLQWYSQFASPQAIQGTADWGANLFRAAMYTGEGGYLSRPEEMQARLTEAVDSAIQQDMYTIIDWHILSDGSPMVHAEEAERFFTAMAQRYGDQPAVLYEICNEPNGSATWEGDVKPYAQRMIQAIRTYAPRSVILVGSPTWSQDIHLAAGDPLEGENLMYTLHFYAGTHGQQLRDRADYALSRGLPLFVSEWGTSRADGGGGIFLEESRAWLDFLDSRGISWCAWSLCDKDESSAALLPGASPEDGWSEHELSTSGQFVFSRFQTTGAVG